MGKKILILTASPHKNGNSSKMADAFARGAESAGHTTVRFDAAFKNIGGCIACNKCWSTGTACAVKDDFNELEPLLESCDTVVFASPLYWCAFPAQIKGAIDKLYAYGGAGGTRPLAIKESYLLLCSESADEKFCGPLFQAYQISSEFLNWKDRGILHAHGVEAEGAIEKSGYLEQAGEMGKTV